MGATILKHAGNFFESMAIIHVPNGKGYGTQNQSKLKKFPSYQKKFFFLGGEKILLIFCFFASFEMIPSNSKFINLKSAKRDMNLI